MKPLVIIIMHQLIFQGMFVFKNILLHKKTGKQIRGKNKEATNAVIFFTVFITIAILLSCFKDGLGSLNLANQFYANISGIVLLIINLIISAASLLHLKDSWRVGVVENQTTPLITSGIYQYTRNPYFVSYLIMFAAYTLMLQNGILFALSILGFLFIHKMILKEEAYLKSAHKDEYKKYIKKVPRYLLF